MTWPTSFTLHAYLKLDLGVNGQSRGVMSKAAVKERRGQGRERGGGERVNQIMPQAKEAYLKQRKKPKDINMLFDPNKRLRINGKFI